MTPRDAGTGLVGKLLSGRYRIEAFVAQSSGGALYRGEHVHMRKRIAVKVLGAAAAAAPEALARFEREAIAGAHVDHPNVAAAKDFGALDDGARFLVVEYLEGQTLRQLLDEVRALPAERALRVARQLALGLSAAHQRGIVHRALAPDNVWLVSRGGEDDVVKVVDFGSAMLPPELVSARPAPGLPDRLATPVAPAPSVLPYASPEVVLGGSIDGRSDLYSLGVMLHEMFGVAPAQLRGGAPPAPAMPAGLAALARRLVARDPAQRPESAEEVADALERIDSGTRRASLVSAGELATGETVLSQRAAAATRRRRGARGRGSWPRRACARSRPAPGAAADGGAPVPQRRYRGPYRWPSPGSAASCCWWSGPSSCARRWATRARRRPPPAHHPRLLRPPRAPPGPRRSRRPPAPAPPASSRPSIPTPGRASCPSSWCARSTIAAGRTAWSPWSAWSPRARRRCGCATRATRSSSWRCG
ncbi:MAG: serine/threonine-protein kinase [Polyangiaceae bacterium]